ncbi:MAG TPA: LysR substrate-binding domain-containing protein, partial [Pseudoduganella sp.]
PRSLDDLARHSCLLWHLQGRLYDKWGFPAEHTGTATARGRRTVHVKGPLASDDADVVRRWAVAGEGIAYKSWLDVSADVGAGRLVVVLPGQPGEASPLQLICPHRRQFSPAVRLLHALLVQRCGELGMPPAHPA